MLLNEEEKSTVWKDNIKKSEGETKLENSEDGDGIDLEKHGDHVLKSEHEIAFYRVNYNRTSYGIPTELIRCVREDIRGNASNW